MTNSRGLLALIAAISLGLAACGGGESGDSSPTSTPPPPNPPPTNPPNAAPTVSGTPAASVTVGQTYTFQPSASDPDGDALTFSATGLPGWSTFNSTTGQLSGTPSAADVGVTAGIAIAVSDGRASAVLATFQITVVADTPPPPPPPPANTAPSISGTPAMTVQATTAYSFTPSASDPEGQSLTFSIANKPSWASFSSVTGRLSGTPSAAQAGTFGSIVISVSDGALSAALPAFAITVTAAPNSAPIISGSPATTVQATTAYSFTPTASDANGDTLTFSVSGKPSWASFNTSTGRLNGTPSSSQVQTYSNIVISVSDGKVSASLPAFAITVTSAPNSAPTISGTPATSVVAGNAYSFTPTANDTEGDTLTFSISGKPSWASFNASTGKLNGTPSSSQVQTYSNIVISVSDGKVSASLPAFAITVTAAANSAPTISGTPATSVVAGNAYNFTPTASDADGDTLAFSIAGKPSWATFSSATGQVSGTPTSAQAGSYMNIVISVSDGTATTALSAFAITVSQPAANGTAALSWTAPTQNTDGSQLTDLAGYRLYHGTSPTNLADVVLLQGTGTTSYTFSQLASGTHYFAVAAYNMSGVESTLSGIGSKNIP